MDKIVKANSLSKSYKKKIALDDLSLDLDQGKVYGLLGPNGSGKTTLLKVLAGLVKADRGRVSLLGERPSYKTKAFTAYLPDRYFLIENMTIRETIEMFDDFYEDYDKNFSNKLIEYFNLDPKDTTNSLSKGDREKLNLSLVLARDAKIYLLDEPLDGLDPISIAKITDIIIDKIGENRTFIITTHQINEIENLFDELIFLDRGKVISLEKADDIHDEKGISISDYYNGMYVG